MKSRPNRNHRDRTPQDAGRLLTQDDLARRWRMTARSLERWRSQGTGPKWMKIGGLARYRLEDVLQYEMEQRR